MTINICLATDENYLKYMATTIVSILKNASINDNLHFYILCNNISDLSKNYISDLKRFKNCEITFLDLDINEFSKFPKGGPHITNTTYYRYKIAELLPDVDKIIYLDCDMIVKESLSELFNTDITNFYLGGVEDVGYYFWKNYNSEFIYKDGFYINAGMLLINLKAWRENDLFNKFINFTIQESNKIAIGDQDVINQVCKGKIKQLDYKWNAQDSFYRDKPEREYNPNCQQIIEASKKPAIIHYTFIKKPWNCFSIPKSKDWSDIYLLLTKNKKDKLKSDILKYKKLSIFKNIIKIIFSIKNENSHKVIRICGFKIKIKRKQKCH